MRGSDTGRKACWPSSELTAKRRSGPARRMIHAARLSRARDGVGPRNQSASAAPIIRVSARAKLLK